MLIGLFSCLLQKTDIEMNYSILISQSLIGIGFSLYGAALFGSIPHLVESKLLGTAFGIRAVAENIGLIFIPMIVGTIMEKNKQGDIQDYRKAFYVLLSIIFASLILGIWIHIDDV
jgi:sugar phosphate permease